MLFQKQSLIYMYMFSAEQLPSIHHKVCTCCFVCSILLLWCTNTLMYSVNILGKNALWTFDNVIMQWLIHEEVPAVWNPHFQRILLIPGDTIAKNWSMLLSNYVWSALAIVIQRTISLMNCVLTPLHKGKKRVHHQ